MLYGEDTRLHGPLTTDPLLRFLIPSVVVSFKWGGNCGGVHSRKIVMLRPS
jgi:hypothetical protein